MPFISASAISPFNKITGGGFNSAFSFGNALKSRSGSDFVSYASGLTALNNTNSASIHSWINKDSGKVANVGNNKDSSNRISLLCFNDGNAYLSVGNGGNSFGSFSFSAYEGNWALVSLVFNGLGATNSDRLKAYVNGSEQSLTFVGTIPSSLSSSVATDFRINSVEVSGTFGEAEYDEIVLTSDASTLAQHQAFYNSGNGALGTDSFTNIFTYWRCNGVDGDTTLIDSVGTATGTLNNFVVPYFIPHV
jgi:hypothetical protein